MKNRDRAKLILNTLDEGFGRRAREVFFEIQLRDFRRQVEREIASDLHRAALRGEHPMIVATLDLTADRLLKGDYEKEE